MNKWKYANWINFKWIVELQELKHTHNIYKTSSFCIWEEMERKKKLWNDWWNDFDDDDDDVLK